MSKLVVYTIILVILTITNLSANDPPVFKAIKNNDLPAIAEFINNNDINGIYGTDSTTLLIYSVLFGSNKAVEYILNKGAEPDMFVKGMSPLMHAVMQ